MYSVFAILLLLPFLQAKPEFADVRIEKEFEPLLLSNSLLMEVTGAKIIKMPNGHQAILGVASTVLENDLAPEVLRAERVCKIKALAAVVAEKQGVQIARLERTEDRTTVVLQDGKETAKSVSELVEITQGKVRGIVRDMPVVGRWRSKDGKVFYLAVGVICDKKGDIILPMKSEKRKGG